MQDVPRALETVQAWQRRELTDRQQHAYTTAAHVLRWEPADAPIPAPRLLDARRASDQGQYPVGHV